MSSGDKHECLFVSALHVLVSSPRGHAFYFRIFPCFTPCVRFSPHTAFHRRILADLRPSLRYSLQVPSSLRPLLFSTGSAAYCSSSAYILVEDVQYLSSDFIEVCIQCRGQSFLLFGEIVQVIIHDIGALPFRQGSCF